MHEFNLDQIWQESEPQAQEHYQKVEAVIIEMAIRKSQNILQKVLKIAIWELILGSVLVVLACILLWPNPILFWASMVCFSVILSISWRQLFQLQKRVRAIHTHHTKKAIQEYIHMLEAYKNRISLYLIYLTPVTFLAGVTAGLVTQTKWPGHFVFDWSTLSWLAFSIAGLFILVNYVRKTYLPWSVGQHIKELQQLAEEY